jgi:hypothetical protein
MSNVIENNLFKTRLFGKTIRDIDNNSTASVIPMEFAKELDIENSKVLMFLLDDAGGNRYLVVSKYHNEIVID